MKLTGKEKIIKHMKKIKWKALGEICSIFKGEQLNKKDMLKIATYPVINGGTSPSGYIENYNQKENTITISQGGASVGYVNFIETKFWLGAHAFAINPNDKVSKRYIYHFLKKNQYKLENKKVGATIPNISKNDVQNFLIPLPPLKKQEEIAAVLDKFTELTEELTEELTAREAQYDYYRNLLLSQEWIEREEGKEVEWKRLEEICKISTGKLNANAKTENGKYPFFTCNEIPSKINTYSFNTTAILLSGNGSKVGHINLYSGKFDAYQRTYVIELLEKNIDIKFLYYFFKTFIKTYINKNKMPCSIPYITLPILQNFTISFPSLKTQEKIVNILDSFETLVNDIRQGLPKEIELRQKQYEYYREKLLTF